MAYVLERPGNGINTLSKKQTLRGMKPFGSECPKGLLCFGERKRRIGVHESF